MHKEEYPAYVQKKQQQKDEAALRYILEDERGRWFLERLFKRCHMEASTFGDLERTNGMMIFEGERRVALDILRNIRLLGPEGLKGKQLAETERMTFEESLKQILEDNYEEEL